MSTSVQSKLIQLAAQMATGLNMPSDYHEDWGFPKSVSDKQACRVLKKAREAREQCKEWAFEVRRCANELSAGDNHGK